MVGSQGNQVVVVLEAHVHCVDAQAEDLPALVKPGWQSPLSILRDLLNPVLHENGGAVGVAPGVGSGAANLRRDFLGGSGRRGLVHGGDGRVA